ncbi:MAG: arginine--tRNA ligase [Ardenticatenales bacterium]|nr:arginine--tRNA ligase [Ardenticatenales bacterium]
MRVHQDLGVQVAAALQSAQTAGDLPAFPIPAIKIERPRDSSRGDYATAVALQLARAARMAPLKIAQRIAEHLPALTYLEAADVAAPGFINFRLRHGYLQNLVQEIVDTGSHFGDFDLGAGKKAQVEFVSANPTGPITIGRTRGGVIGDTLARVLATAGYEVTREYYYNDAGNQIRLLGESVKIRYRQILGDAVTLGDEHYQGDYIYWIAAVLVGLHGDTLRNAPTETFANVARNTMFANQKATLRRVNIVHDVYYNEQDLYTSGRVWQALNALAAKEMAYQEDGAWWFRSTAVGDEKDRVLVKSSGEPAYRMTDIAYHWHKAERGFALVVDIFGPDHHTTAQTVLQGVQALGYSPDFVHTLIHQIVSLMRDGKQVRMSTRRGQYEALDDLVDEVGADAVRYFMLARSANSPVEFDMNLAVEQSDKNPVFYIQNAHVRCAGIFRKWQEAGFDPHADADADLSLLTHEFELNFLRKALELHEILEQIATTYEPHHIAFYAYDLAATFHPVYEACRVLHSDVPEPLRLARLRFYRAAQILFARVLDLMGMSAPDVM